MFDVSRERLTDHELREPLAGMSVRHLEVLRLMATGYTNDHIAWITGAAVSTVERWTAEIFRHLGIETRGIVNPRVEAVRAFIAVAGVPQR